MKKFMFAFVLSLILTVAASAEPAVTDITMDAGGSTHTFTPHTFVYKDIHLPYREDVIHEETEGAPALVIFLHGGSGAGNDNITQMETAGIQEIAAYLQSAGRKAILLVPQCTKEKMWGNSAKDDSASMPTVLEALIQKMLTERGADPAQVYILGASAGGAGVWRMVSLYGDLFAAAMPCAAAPKTARAEKTAAVPLCVVAGENDSIGKQDKITAFVEQLRTLGGDIHYDVLAGCSHVETCRQAWTEEHLAWVFGHTKTSVDSRHQRRRPVYGLSSVRNE